MNNEEKKELQQRADEAAKLNRLIRQGGWKDVLKPALDRMRAAALNKVINSELDRNLVRQQELVKVIDWFFSFIKTSIAEGEAASAKLEEEKK